jgi:type VI secretion system secreted protein Hcp
MAIYMKYGDINGDVSETGHKNWIELSAVRLTAGRSIMMAIGSGADREGDIPWISDIYIEKDHDIASGNLLSETLGGGSKDVKIDFTRTNKNVQDVYLTLELTNVMVSAHMHEGQGERPIEKMTLNATKIAMKTTQMKPDATEAQPFTVTYDLTTGQLT